jgi:two-component system, chemotaxis family, sensor kinase CheA
VPAEYGTEALLREFLEEAEDHFEVLNRDLLEIERGVAAGSAPAGPLLDEMFRAVHTLKGLSAMFDFVHIKELAHAIEGVFDGMRKTSAVPEPATLDLLFASVDVLQHAVATVLEDPEADIDAAENAAADIERYLDAVAPSTADTVETAEGGLSEYTRKRLATAAGEGVRGLTIRLRWGIELRLGGLRMADIETALGNLGEVLEVRPALTELPPLAELDPASADVAFDVVVLSDRSDRDIADSLGLGVASMRPMTREGAAATSPTPGAAAASAPKAAGGGQGSSAVRVDIGRLDALVDLAGELVTARTRLKDLSAAITARDGKEELASALRLAVREVSGLVEQLQDSVMRLRMVPVGHLFSRFPRVVRDLARASGKEIQLAMHGEETELDKRVIEQIEDSLLHILRNACDHGIEPADEREAAGKPRAGTITLSATQEGDQVVISVSDDGRGLDVERIRSMAAEAGIAEEGDSSDETLLDVIMSAGFSTATTVTELSGRGVGLDVVRRKTEDLGGHVQVESAEGRGTRFLLRIPLTLAIMPALLVETGGDRFAIPLSAVSGVLRIRKDELRSIEGVNVLDLRGETVAVVRLSEVLGLAQRDVRAVGRRRDTCFVVDTLASGRRLGLLVDALIGQQEIVVKSLEDVLERRSQGVSGATILGDGSIVPILDTDRMVHLLAGTGSRRAARDGGEC